MHSLDGKQPSFQPDSGRAVASDPVGCDHALARDDEREAIVGAERPGGARRTRTAGESGELAVRDDLAPRNCPGCGGELVLQRRCPLELERDVVIHGWHAGEVGREPAAELRHELGTKM